MLVSMETFCCEKYSCEIYESSSTHCSNIIDRLTFAKSSPNSKVKIVGKHGKVFPLVIFMLNIKALALTVQKLLERLNFSKRRPNSKV